MRLSKITLPGLAVLVLLLAGCNNNLLPSDEDKRMGVVAGSLGKQPTQKVANATVKDISGNDVSLYDFIAAEGGATPADAIVIYFTMWCSTCLTHMSDLYNDIRPTFSSKGNVKYIIVDFVSGSVSSAKSSARAYGFDSTEFVVLADTERTIRDQLGGNMGITLVIDSTGIIKLNQEYRSGEEIDASLSILFP